MDIQIMDKMDPEMTGTGVPEPGSLSAIRMKNTVDSIHGNGSHMANQAQRSPLRKLVRQIAMLKRAIVASAAPSILNFKSIKFATLGFDACSSFQLMPVMLCMKTVSPLWRSEAPPNISPTPKKPMTKITTSNPIQA